MTRRVMKLVCFVLNRDLGFGKRRLEYVLAGVADMVDISKDDEMFWRHCDKRLNQIGLDFSPEDYDLMDREWK